MTYINAVGIDMAFANMGLARVKIEATPASVRIRCDEIHLVSTKSQDRKEVRKSSDDLRRARELLARLESFCIGQQVAFAEVPSGSQNAAAARLLGVAVGVLASCPIPVIEVSQLEVKMASVGKKKATKEEMIAWAVELYPEAPWLRDKKGKLLNANEHLADALATVEAGVRTEEFRRLISLVSAQSAINTVRKKVML